MKRILKSIAEPQALADYKARFRHAPAERTWKKFTKQTKRRNDVKIQLRNDQRGLCCYCENTLVPEDESVEHFIARNSDHSRELDWSNLLLCCAGGERPLPEHVADSAFRYEPGNARTCGHAKLASNAMILNPIAIPAFPRFFQVRSETGEVLPDIVKCLEAGIDPVLVAQTIADLGLHAGRLNKARLVTMEALTQLLAVADGLDQPFSTERERQLAAEQIPAAGTLPGFFTTIRFFLGDGCEQHLGFIGYQG